MRKLSFIILSVFMLAITINKAQAQGCVAIRSTGGYTGAEKGMADSGSKYEFSVNQRYYRSFRHYVGLQEQKQRVAAGNEVINHGYTMDLNLVRNLNPRWSLMVDMPILANMRSQTYTEDNVLHRFATHSFGIGDIRFAAYAWLVNPTKSPRGNIQVGLGLKLATGNYNYQDYFRNSDTTTQYGPVDQSIQLGDGGTGITTEINAFYNISPKFSVYGNWYYLISPRDQNGTNNYHTPAPSASSVANGSNVMSVPDQLMARVGFDYMVKAFTFSAGMREECLPVHDLVGGSDGFRRPGYIMDVEPGVTWSHAKTTLYLFVPIAVVRDRTQSVPDKISTALTGKYTQGDAAFADYVVNIGATFRF